MKRTSAFIFILPFLISCASTQSNYEVFSEAATFEVTIVNNAQFDISIFPDEYIIPSGNRMNISLPIQNNQLTQGYPLTCYVNIADDVIKAIKCEYNLIIKKEDKIRTIDDDNIYFECDESFFVITNRSNSVIRTRRANNETYRWGLGPGTKREGTRIELPHDKTYAYLSDDYPCLIQNERDMLFAIPHDTRKGFVSHFIFDGSAVIPTDVRPVHEIGGPAPLTVEFVGDNLSETEQREIIEALNAALKSNGVPLRPLFPEEQDSFEGRMFYAMRLALQTRIQPAQPPINYDLIIGEAALTLLRNGMELRGPETKRITAMGRADVLRNVFGFVKEASMFYQGIKADMSF